MSSKRARTATAMSCFLAIGLIASCMRIETSGPDGSGGGGGNHVLPDAYIPTTSLSGSIACGSFTCGPQTVCMEQSGGLDAGLAGDAGTYGVTYSCATVPTSCRIFDCYSDSCTQCIRDLCYYGATYGVYVTGRYLTCPGV